MIMKPPLGLKPRYIQEEQRLAEIISAIERYCKAKVEIPLVWIDEYNDLVISLEDNTPSPKSL